MPKTRKEPDSSHRYRAKHLADELSQLRRCRVGKCLGRAAHHPARARVPVSRLRGQSQGTIGLRRQYSTASSEEQSVHGAVRLFHNGAIKQRCDQVPIRDRDLVAADRRHCR